MAPQKIPPPVESTSAASMGNSFTSVSVPPTILFCAQSQTKKKKAQKYKLSSTSSHRSQLNSPFAASHRRSPAWWPYSRTDHHPHCWRERPTRLPSNCPSIPSSAFRCHSKRGHRPGSPGHRPKSAVCRRNTRRSGRWVRAKNGFRFVFSVEINLDFVSDREAGNKMTILVNPGHASGGICTVVEYA